MMPSKNPKDIAVFIPSFAGGGAERVLLTIANELSDRGFMVDLLAATGKGPYKAEVGSDLNLVDFQSRGVLASLPSLTKYLRKHHPRILLTGLGRCNLVSIWAQRLAGVSTRLCIGEHNTLSIAARASKTIRARVIFLLGRFWYPKADCIIPVSNGVAEDLCSSYRLDPEKIDVIYNPVVSEKIITQRYEKPRHSWFEEKEYPVILGVGRLTPQKDFATLLRAFAKVRDTFQVRLIILGEGNERSKLEKISRELGVKQYVDLPGFVNNPFAYMHHASLFVLSSAWEGLSCVLIEAMACGTPVVSTDCPSGPAEILENGKWGRLVPVGDAGALASAIIETLNAPQHPDVEKRAQDFSVTRIIDQYEKTLGLT